ncbi:MAG TPA: hypothetical protein PLS50_07105, partial [Candidatus Dojkabacteria bacterium]|nr:hypothetical protein [Candidatus Dojkabacteria bacterium]
RLICRADVPYTIATDGGGEVGNSTLAQEMLKLEKAILVTSLPDQHQTMGSVERTHRSIKEKLLQSCGKDTSSWHWRIDGVVRAINTAPSRRINYLSPYQLMYGRNPHLPDYMM